MLSIRGFRHSQPQDAPASSQSVVWRQRHGVQIVRFVSQLSMSAVGQHHRLFGVPRGSVLGPILFLLYTANLISLVETHGLRPHHYIDDTQIFSSCRPCDTAQLQSRVSVCIDDVGLWMRSNRLQLNMTKMDVLWCASSRRQLQNPDEPLRVGSDLVQPVRSVRNLAIHLDSDLSMNTHITRTVSCCFVALRQIRSISRSVSQPIVQSLNVSLVIVHSS